MIFAHLASVEHANAQLALVLARLTQIADLFDGPMETPPAAKDRAEPGDNTINGRFFTVNTELHETLTRINGQLERVESNLKEVASAADYSTPAKSLY